MAEKSAIAFSAGRVVAVTVPVVKPIAVTIFAIDGFVVPTASTVRLIASKPVTWVAGLASLKT